MSKNTNRFARSTVALVVLLLAAAVTRAQGATNSSLPAQPLGDALRAVGIQTNTSILFDPEIVAAFQAPALEAGLTRDEALLRLLVGTGLKYEFLNDETVAVARKVQSHAETAGETPYTLNSLDETFEQERALTARFGERHRTLKSGSPVMDNGRQGPDVDESVSRSGARPTTNENEVVITGSQIRGMQPSASPMLQFSREAIEATGFSNLSQFVASLPQNFSGTVSAVGLDVGGGGLNLGTAADLRGLGVGTTLTLLNGRRVAPSGFGEFVDVSVIPLSIVKRVDVLTDGASATYGSDAIGGVINYVLRNDFDGAETAIRYGEVSKGTLSEVRASQIVGRSWKHGSAIASYEFYDRGNLPVADRSFVNQGLVGGDLSPEQQRHGVFVSARQELASQLVLSGDVLCSRRNASLFIKANSSSFPNPSESVNDEEQCSFASGITYEFPKTWFLEIAANFGQYKRNDRFTADVQSAGPGGVPILTRSTSITHTESDVWSVGATISGPLINLPGGAARAAFGVDYRNEGLSRVFRTNGDVAPTSSREVAAAFAEAFVPIVGRGNARPGLRRLEFTVAGRYDRYSDFGSTVNPKFGVLYSPAEELNLRATFGRSFRAPFLYQGQGDFGGSAINPVAFQLPNPFSATARGPIVLLLSGDPNGLSPEKATLWTAGLDIKPLYSQDLTVRLTYYNIDYTNRIDNPVQGINVFQRPDLVQPLLTLNPSEQELVALIADMRARNRFFDFSGLNVSDPSNVLQIGGIIDQRVRNIGSVITNGIDAALDYGFASRLGDVGFSINGTYAIKYERQLLPALSALDILDRPGSPLDLRLRAGAFWSRGGSGASVFINYADDYVNTDTVQQERIASHTTVDAQLRFTASTRFKRSLLDGVTLVMSVQNIFDRNPPRLGFDGVGGPSAIFIAPIGYDPANAEPTGRFFALELSKRW